MTPNRHQGSRQMGLDNPTQGLRFSQVSLPCDSQGTIDFSNYPLRVSLPAATKKKNFDRFVSYFYSFFMISIAISHLSYFICVRKILILVGSHAISVIITSL
jgi:hypothetical protein